MTDTRLDEIIERTEAATPGPWKWIGNQLVVDVVDVIEVAETRQSLRTRVRNVLANVAHMTREPNPNARHA